MTIEDLRNQGLIIFECISGSKAYGLDLPHSDTDLKGVFVLPENKFYGLEYIEQVSDEGNNEVFYELKRFTELLAKNNPNLLEMLASPERCIIYQHPLFKAFKSELFLSRLCKDTFAGYAMSQIKKARGLNKKILNPVEKERKNILHFCHITHENGTLPLPNWLEKMNIQQEQCGLVNLSHIKGLYALYIDDKNEGNFQGIMRKEEANEPALSSVPKGSQLLAYLYFNSEGYSVYCKDYKAYWEWVEKRNDARYEGTLAHGKNYDAKNMMHTFRLLEMAKEMIEKGEIKVERPNREELLKIRAGEFEYEELLEKAEEKMAEIERSVPNSPLPLTPDLEAIEKTLITVRQGWYQEKRKP
jgi:uncharacterized protein